MKLSLKWTIQRRLIFFIVLVFLCAAVIIINFTNHNISREITARSMKYFSAMVNQVAERMNAYINRNAQYVDLLTTRSRVLYQLTDIVEGDQNLHVHAYKIVREVLNLNPWDMESLEGICIFPSTTGEPINCYYRTPTTELDPYSELLLRLGGKDELIWAGYRSDKDVLTIHRRLFSQSGGIIGLMMVSLSKDYVHNIIDNVLADEGMIMLCADQYGRVLCSNDRSLENTFSSIRAMSENQAMEIRLSNGWKIIGIIPTAQIAKDISNFNLIFASVFLGLFMLILGILSLHTRWLLKPMNLIMDGMERIKGGALDTQLPLTGSMEFDAMIHTFNTMTETIRERNLTIYRQQKVNYEARMNALQAQKDPHFLYNMLNAVYWMAFSRDEEEIAKMVLSLSKMLRYSITNAGTHVRVEDDMAQIEQYLSVMQLRFPDKLEYEIHIDPEMNDRIIPIFLLQPLVENAIHHGLKELHRNGRVVITGRILEDDSLLFTVEDNGAGLNSADLQADGTVRNEGVGLRLVRECIEYNYGAPYGMKIRSEFGHTTCEVHVAGAPPVVVDGELQGEEDAE